MIVGIDCLLHYLIFLFTIHLFTFDISEFCITLLNYLCFYWNIFLRLIIWLLIIFNYGLSVWTRNLWLLRYAWSGINLVLISNIPNSHISLHLYALRLLLIYIWFKTGSGLYSRLSTRIFYIFENHLIRNRFRNWNRRYFKL